MKKRFIALALSLMTVMTSNSFMSITAANELTDADISETANGTETADDTDIPSDYDARYGYRELPSDNDAKSIRNRYNSKYPATFAVSTDSQYVPEEGDLPHLRNQYPYGTCWAHASTLLAEMSMCKQGYADTSNVDYSELHLAYFTYHTPKDPLGGLDGDSFLNVPRKDDDFLEAGGNLAFSSNVYANWIGAVDESHLPYTVAEKVNDYAGDSSVDISGLKLNAETEYSDYSDKAHLTSYYKINIKEDRDVAKKYIKDNGAIGITYFDDDDSYNEDGNAYYYTGNENGTNHAVVAVGWDDKFSKEKFSDDVSKQPAADGAWLVRNSWITSDTMVYSHDAYFWISYYDKSLNNTAYTFNFSPINRYDNNYQYDGSPESGTLTDVTKSANVFTAKACENGEVLKAVSAYFKDVNSEYQVDIYKNLTDDTDPESGKLVKTINGTTTLEGYYLIDLETETPVKLSEGDTFSIVVSYSQPSTISFEYRHAAKDLWYKAEASAKEGQSFLTFNNSSSWDDLGYKYDCNLRIKAFTKNISEEDAVEPAKVVITDEFPDKTLKLAPGTTYRASADVLPEDSDYKQIIWSSSDEAVAKVNEHGVVEAIANGSALITATSAKASTLYDSFTVEVSNLPTTLTITTDEEYGITNGKSERYSVIVEPDDAEYDPEDIVWSIDNTDIVNFTNDVCTGDTIELTALHTGAATLTARYGYTAEAEYVVYVYPVEPVISSLVLGKDNSITLTFDNTFDADEYWIVRGTKENNEEYEAGTIYQDAGTKTFTFTDNDYVNAAAPQAVRYKIVACTNLDDGKLRYSCDWSDWLYPSPVYNITYNLGEHCINNGSNPNWFKYQSPIELNAPTVAVGYKFNGWRYYTNNLGDSAPLTKLSEFQRDVTLIPDVTPITYTITFNGNGNTNTSTVMSDMECTYGAARKLLLNTFEKTGYQFKCWNTQANGKGTSYADVETVKNLTTADKDTITLYAQWVPNTPDEPDKPSTPDSPSSSSSTNNSSSSSNSNSSSSSSNSGSSSTSSSSSVTNSGSSDSAPIVHEITASAGNLFIAEDQMHIDLPNIDSSKLMLKGKAGIYDPATGTLKALKKGTVKLYYLEGKKKIVVCTIKFEQPKLKKKLKMKAGKVKKLKLTGTKNTNITWASSDENIATVQGGIITAKASGTCTITAAIGNHKYDCTLLVK